MATKVNGQEIPEDGKYHKVDVGGGWFMNFRSPGGHNNEYDAVYGETGGKDHWHTWSTESDGQAYHDPDRNPGKGMLAQSQQDDKDDKSTKKK